MDAVNKKQLNDSSTQDISHLSRIAPSSSFDVPLSQLSPGTYENEKERDVDLINSVKLEWNTQNVIHLHSIGNSRFSFNQK